MANNPIRKLKKYDCRNGSVQLSRNLRLPIHYQRSPRNANALLIGPTQHAMNTIRKNIVNADSSLVIFDNGGTLWQDTHALLEEKGFRVSALFFTNEEESLHYNPLVYVSLPEELEALSDILTHDDDINEKLWKDSSTLVTLLVRYMMKTTPKSNWSFAETYRISCNWLHDEDPLQALNAAFSDCNDNREIKREYEAFMSHVENLSEVCLHTAQSFLPFILPLTEKKFNTDSLYLCDVGEVNKDVLFIITDEGDNTYNKIIHMLWQQLYDELYERFDSKPIKVLIPNLEQYGVLPHLHLFLLTLRHRHVCAMLHIYSPESLSKLYPYSEEILGDCDSCILYNLDEPATPLYSDKISECYNLAKDSTKIHWPWGKEPETEDINDVVAAASKDAQYCIVCVRGYTPTFDFQI
jgi:type IV secretory pathway TraG/TraD family ATPase VirD4